jgi:deoxyribodipyrimidine photo-lyase
MNPWTQSEKFDKSAEYIKKWIPELKDVPPKELHNWEKYYDKYNYIKPIVNYEESRKKSIETYKKIL